MTHPSFPSELPGDFASALEALSRHQRLDVESMKLLVLIESAGEPLYGAIAELAPEGEARELLQQNGREERGHAYRIKKAIEIATGADFEIPPLSENPYAEPPDLRALGGLTRGLLQGVVDGEEKGYDDYHSYAEREPNERIAELLRENGREEQRHAGRVRHVIELLTG